MQINTNSIVNRVKIKIPRKAGRAKGRVVVS